MRTEPLTGREAMVATLRAKIAIAEARLSYPRLSKAQRRSEEAIRDRCREALVELGETA